LSTSISLLLPFSTYVENLLINESMIYPLSDQHYILYAFILKIIK